MNDHYTLPGLRRIVRDFRDEGFVTFTLDFGDVELIVKCMLQGSVEETWYPYEALTIYSAIAVAMGGGE